MIRRLALMASTAVAVVVVGAAPAHAADEIGLSTDGLTWSNELTSPLFDPDFRVVPGDVEERSFLVRNDGPSAGVLTVDVVAEDPDLLLADSDIVLEAKVGNRPWVPVDEGETRAVTELKVPEDAITRVRLRATFAWESTRELQSIPFRVELTLSEDGDVAGEGEGDGDGDGNGQGDGDGTGGQGDGDGDALPDTGNGIAGTTLWVAAGLIGAGIALLRPSRRREEASRG
ncbi:hypothetical protein ACFQ0K_17920 [Nocardioides caeni]|uniref:LPXTG cell wall anchor domain-containing protein n=1 Tax=Nocardioides caeni TaxID=574700 RepID=A0A4S8NAM8_9ACTN|nr:hypothetical protein [Nocardioides caeni]THV13357.1 hypothetical protein E9934_10365 [Nocardioides caeni]